MKQLFLKIESWFGFNQTLKNQITGVPHASDEFKEVLEKTQIPLEISEPIKTFRIYGEIGDMPNFNLKQNLHSKYNKGVGVYRDRNGRFTSIKTNKK